MNLEQITEMLVNSATVTEDFMGAAEAVLVSIVGRVACWLAPLPSAVLVSQAVSVLFNLNEWWAVVIAAVLELVGLVTSNLWLTAREWNSTKLKSAPDANEQLALRLMVSYFVTAFLLLLSVELSRVLGAGIGDWVRLVTALLFPVLSVVGVVALNERVTHYHRVNEVKAAKTKRASTNTSKKVSKSVQNNVQRSILDVQENAQEGVQSSALDVVNASRRERKTEVLDAMLDIYKDDSGAGPTEVSRRLGIGRSTVYNYLGELEEAGKLRSNGDGWEVVPR